MCTDSGGNHFYYAIAGWQACIGSGGDAHSSYTANPNVGSDGTPQAGSPVFGAGTNLSALCTGILASLCTDYNGALRPTTGSWTVGAFN